MPALSSLRAAQGLPMSGHGRATLAMLAVLAVSLLLALGWYAKAEGDAEAASRALATHSVDVLRHNLALQNAAQAMESEHRGYLVRGERHFLASRDRFAREASAELAQLRRLTADNPGQQQRLASIQALLAARVARMHRTSDPGLAIEDARAHFAATGRASFVPIDAAIAGFDREESRLLQVRSAQAADRAAQLRTVLLVVPGLGVVLLLAGAAVLAGQLGRSERLAAELAAANDEARQALQLVDAVHEGVFVYGAEDLRIAWANRGAAEQLGVPRESLQGVSMLAIKSGMEEASLRALLEPLLAGKMEALSFETTHRHAEGVDVPVEVSVRLAGAVDGRRMLVSVARDTSARVAAERERDRFFSLSLDMLCISSADGYFKRLSPAFTRTLGWSVEELLARPYYDFIHPDDLVATQEQVDAQAQRGATVFDFENRFRHRDGGWRWLSWKSAPQPDGRMYATARDVTERKDAEEQAAQLNLELAVRQAELQTANRELEAFSYSISHDLRAPLRHIDGYARMLEEDAGEALAAEPRRYLRTITDSARRMGALIDDLLAFSRLGRKALVLQRVDMAALVERALADLPEAARAPGIVEVGPLPVAAGDPALLQQVWVNLLSNAAKYSAPRGAQARIRIEAERQGAQGLYRVRDNGVGFDMRYADKLFGVFQRLHGPDQFEGTGVGLAIVQRIVARHGGTVAAQSAPGEGACFEFRLPLHAEEAA